MYVLLKIRIFTYYIGRPDFFGKTKQIAQNFGDSFQANIHILAFSAEEGSFQIRMLVHHYPVKSLRVTAPDV